MKILVLDPGESTGYVLYSMSSNEYCSGGTLPRNHAVVATLLESTKPDVVVIERFNLFPGKAASLSWNSFYPCEVIGVVRYICTVRNIPLVEQAPGDKKFAGWTKDDPLWKKVREGNRKNTVGDVTEHTKDACMHLLYCLRNGKHLKAMSGK